MRTNGTRPAPYLVRDDRQHEIDETLQGREQQGEENQTVLDTNQVQPEVMLVIHRG